MTNQVSLATGVVSGRHRRGSATAAVRPTNRIGRNSHGNHSPIVVDSVNGSLFAALASFARNRSRIRHLHVRVRRRHSVVSIRHGACVWIVITVVAHTMRVVHGRKPLGIMVSSVVGHRGNLPQMVRRMVVRTRWMSVSISRVSIRVSRVVRSTSPGHAAVVAMVGITS